MANIKKALVGILLLVVIIFTVVFLANAYNTGKIGNKAEKIADTFSQDIVGTWTGKYSISNITFNEDKTTSLNVLGVAATGKYADDYNLETETHTLTLKYKTILGLSVERKFIAELDGDKLSLTDIEMDSFELRFTRAGSEADTTVSEENTSVYAPDIEKFSSDILGNWTDANGTNSGYEFFDNSTVEIKLMGISYNGEYTTSIDEESGKCLLKITYATVAGINVNNSYYVSIADNVLTLTQKGAEAISTVYKKDKSSIN